ncbi:unnamed protein product [Microthlaspi erraticum]|uniref:Hemerythrin-like domain-containing protein n=1 Tax=Microthlaspi erraticum TaxID=1685480 RepID=A0A6D2J0H6_9BRAS|nr:unnamed protein product [Microthlaspi erraticum]
MVGLKRNVKLCMSLKDVCKLIHKLLSEHLHREEKELWGLFRNWFTIEEPEKIIAHMLGRISGEILQDMIPWLMKRKQRKQIRTQLRIQIHRILSGNISLKELLLMKTEGAFAATSMEGLETNFMNKPLGEAGPNKKVEVDNKDEKDQKLQEMSHEFIYLQEKKLLQETLKYPKLLRLASTEGMFP